MKILVICNTYYQLLMAIQMRLELFQNDTVELWLSDHSVNSEAVLKRLEDINLFSSVKYIKTKDDTYNSFVLDCVKDVIKTNFGNIKNLDVDFFDEICFFNLSMNLFEIADYYKKNNHEVKWSYFEEGVFAYNSYFKGGKRVEYTKKIRKFTKRVDVSLAVKRHYCVFPELVDNRYNWELIKIPELKSDNTKLKKIYNTIFDFNDIVSVNKIFSKKYIYFSSACDSYGCHIGESDLVLKIAEEVGVENLVVKMHPRDTNVSVYEENGITVMKDSFVPWEVIQLNLEQSETVLLTAISGAFVNICAMDDSNIKGVFLCNYLDHNNPEIESFVKKFKVLLQKLHNQGYCGSLYVKE